MGDGNKNLTVQNTKLALADFMEKEKLSVKDVAKALGCPVPVIGRILCGVTWPSETLLKRCHTMFEIGYKDYKKLSEANKEKISELVGTVGSAGLGVGVSLSAVSALGATVGLSGPGIMSGLAALGAIAGGGAAAGVAVAAAIPVAVATGGYLIVKGVKYSISEAQLKAEKFEPRWERPVEEGKNRIQANQILLEALS